MATCGNTSSGHHGEELVEVDSAALVLVHLLHDAVHLLPDEQETLIHNFKLQVDAVHLRSNHEQIDQLPASWFKT